MKRLILASVLAAITAPASSAHAQSRSVSPPTAQDQLDARYDLALAAGYKALMLCSAIGNAEANGALRTPESVHAWELTGIYPALDPIVRDLEYDVFWAAPLDEDSGQRPGLDHVAVTWAEDAPPRWAVYREGKGCFVAPMGATPPDWNFLRTEAPSNPAMERTTSDPMAANIAQKRVDVSAAFTGAYGEGRTTAVTVLHRGKLAGEQYADGFYATTPQRTWSVAKSIAATVIGAAVQRGEAEVTASAGLGADDIDPRRAITIDHALRMATGRYSDTRGNRTDPLYWGGTTVEERAQNWPLIDAPGTIYRYANNDTLAAIMAIDETFEDHPPADLFEKLGMTNTVAETDWRGNYVLSSQVWSTARDLARLGQLYLQDGVWEGERILPEDWRDYVSSPAGPQPEGSAFGYGAAWWLMNQSEGVPSDTFAAFGNRGQYVVVVPSREVVIVRRGENMVGTRFDIAAFTRDVLKSLEN
ncbi:serine hydrolase [Erythrobacter aquimaris]|uniref:Serine hydrolase n=1 Tax=Qipengyuania aquimaris TaxID=255984 RepID=A0A6I4TL71_9SPHN|nr:serine hydrolase [Qipengyuania aquimaris]MXO95930.1 serine hydrolase [Qipengyuania aquimaris]